jgi:histidine ammonia-lyase
MLLISGEGLRAEGVARVAREGEEARLEEKAVARMERSRAVVERWADGEAPVYAVNTGVGLLADTRVTHEELRQLQLNVVRSHACGVGEPLPRDVMRAMMLVRANVLAQGYSGIRPLVAQRLLELLNRGVTPVAPSRGSVGASGDLAPLAHMALVLVGEGEAEYEGRVWDGGEALRRAGLAPLTLEAKEGISLVNGTQAMLGVGVLALLDAEDLAEIADVACAISLDALRGTPRAFDERIHVARPHPGQVACAAHLRGLLEGSEIRASHEACRKVQDAYSMRCAPQIHGAVRDVLSETRRIVEIELNGATDNPLVFGEEMLSGGNFHGQHLALAFDATAVALATLAGVSERRVDRLVNPMLNEGLPAFLAGHPGLESGLMMLQVTAAALVAECRALAAPASTGSLPTSGNKEDYVSMGMTAALKLAQSVRLARDTLTIELLCARQALECLRPLRSGERLERFLAQWPFPVRRDDRSTSGELAQLSAWLTGWRRQRSEWCV